MGLKIKERDVLGRIGKLETKSGTVETPLIFPVVNPAQQIIPPKKIHDVFGFKALITNAYILMKRFGRKPIEKGIHRFLDFDGVIMTDSGAYQILVYGDIETTPEEIVKYQEKIDTDIATILDHPTGWKVTRRYAEKTVNTTLERARELFEIKTRKDISWVGPIQGGQHLDLVTMSANEMTKLPFDLFALGSPTEIMQQYRFDLLLDMIMTTKKNLPIEEPLHLFGAGHPFMFSFAVALGCDLFDSAAYAIYARNDRYMTEYGTHKLKDLEYFPCSCPSCNETDPKEVQGMTDIEKQAFLAEHNLYSCQTEMKRIKTAIKEGRLWELLQTRAYVHPTLLQAVKLLGKYEEYIEKHSPTIKRRGIFLYSSIDLARPEIVRHRKRVIQRYSQPEETEILILIPQTRTKPLHKSKLFKETAEILQGSLKKHKNKIHVCFYTGPFGVVPVELDEVYPLSQHEIALPLDREIISYVAKQVANYIENTDHETVVFIHDPENWKKEVLNACIETCSRGSIHFEYLNIREKQMKNILTDLKNILLKELREKP